MKPDIDERIAIANEKLKTDKIPIRIERDGGKLRLRATLPPRPGAKRSDHHQQRIPLGVSATPNGLREADHEARLIAIQLDRKEFTWEPYLRASGAIPQTVGDWVKQVETAHRHKVSEITWETDYQEVFDTLDLSAMLTPTLLYAAIDKTEPNSRSRKRWCQALGKLATVAGLDVDFKSLKGNYSATQIDPRKLPTDEQIVEWFYKIKNPDWQWVYGAIATWGLRNHEAFFLDIANLQQQGYRATVTEGKTGPREVWACYPEWVDEFELRTKRLPQVTGKRHNDYGDRVTHYFKVRLKLPFTALDLRHCWAIRTIEFGLPVELAARQMGHSYEVHCQTYHRSITAEVHQRAFDLLMMRGDRPHPPQIKS